MASLCKKGQEYKCPFFKRVKEVCEKAPLKNAL